MSNIRAAQKDAEHPRVAALGDRIRGLEAVFSCEGSAILTSPVELLFPGGTRVRVERESRFLGKDIGKKLMKRCEPAPFGVGKETHRDRRVRDGGQLLARDGALRVNGLDLVTTGILAEVHRALCPGDDQAPEAELYALNVYDERGHFVRHKDTPRDVEVFGTLVVCLPVPFLGGRLMLHHESTRAYDWGTSSAYYRSRDQAADHRVRWAAFYGDVDHEIERVRSGTRVTLTWLLRRGTRGKVAVNAPVASEDDLTRALAEAIADPTFVPLGGLLGIPTLHLYAATPGLARPAEAMSAATAERLKGRDRLVARAVARAGLQPRYRPYIFEDCANEAWRLSREPSDGETAIFDGSQLSGDELEEELPIERHVDHYDGDDVTWLVPPPWTKSCPSDAEPAQALLGELEYSGTGYFGNEGSDAAFYSAAALLFDVPTASERHLQHLAPPSATVTKGKVAKGKVAKGKVTKGKVTKAKVTKAKAKAKEGGNSRRAAQR